MRALIQRPNDGFIADSLGWVYYKRGPAAARTPSRRRAGSHCCAGRVISWCSRPSSLAAIPVVSEHLGDVYLLLDQKGRAYEFYQEAVDMGHREDEQPDLLEKLRTLQLELETR